jgi:hypothetical protein
MQTLTIKAMTLESARGFMSGLASFQAQLLESEDGSYLVQITLGRGDREVIALLNALEAYVSQRAQGPAEIGLDGRTYKLHPADPPSHPLQAVADGA